VIVVPNPTLLDNHQVEFAEVMEKMGYVVHGELEYVLPLDEYSELALTLNIAIFQKHWHDQRF